MQAKGADLGYSESLAAIGGTYIKGVGHGTDGAVVADERDQLDEFLRPQLGESESEDLVGEAMLTQQAADDFHEQPLAGHELLQRTMGADSLDGFLTQARLTSSDFVSGPGIVSFKFT